jgi:hypothetical protein
MTAIIISSILIIGIVSALVPYIPKSWIERHIVMEVDPDDTTF